MITDSSTNPALRERLRSALKPWERRIGGITLPVEDMITDIVGVLSTPLEPPPPATCTPLLNTDPYGMELSCLEHGVIATYGNTLDAAQVTLDVAKHMRDRRG